MDDRKTFEKGIYDKLTCPELKNLVINLKITSILLI